MKNKNTILIILVLLITLCIFSIVRLYFELNEYRTFKPKLISLNQVIESKRDSLILEIQAEIGEFKSLNEVIYKDNISNFTDSLLNKRLTYYSNQLANIQQQIVTERKKLEEVKINRQRAINGLPETINLDQLYEKYKLSTEETFYTSKGQISFLLFHFSFLTVPSTNEIAYFRIGKENSNENAALIEAFLEESANSKLKQGYKLVSNNEYPVDYGTYTIKKYIKGDAYFITYFQYKTYQGTYNSKYFRYNYYVEIGSSKRKKQFEIEQFNSKLGS